MGRVTPGVVVSAVYRQLVGYGRSQNAAAANRTAPPTDTATLPLRPTRVSHRRLPRRSKCSFLYFSRVTMDAAL